MSNPKDRPLSSPRPPEPANRPLTGPSRARPPPTPPSVPMDPGFQKIYGPKR